MDIILSKDERIEKLDKKIKEIDTKIERNFARTDESFETFRKIILNLQQENAELRSDRDFLLEKYKEFMRKFSTPGIVQVKDKIGENVNLMKDLVLEGMDIMPEKKGADDLFELVLKKKKLTAKAASRELGVAEGKVKYWALKLKANGLAEIKESPGRFEIVKK